MKNEQAFQFPSHRCKLLWRRLQDKIEATMPNIVIEGYEKYILIRKPNELARVIVFASPGCEWLTVRITQNLTRKVTAYNGVDFALTKPNLETLCTMIPVIMGIATPRFTGKNTYPKSDETSPETEAAEDCGE